MSKTQLKKELSQLDREQLVQLLLDLYSARKEAKAYFDFFINPDINKLTEKYQADIEKEITRGKYTKSTARFSRIRASIRDYASFGVGAEAVIDLMIFTLKLGLTTERRKYVSKTFMSAMTKLAADILKMGDKHELFTNTMNLLEEALNGTYGYIGFVNYVRKSIDWPLISV